MKTLYPIKSFISLIGLCVLLGACHDEDDIIEDDLDPYVDTEAYPILKNEGSLHLFSFGTFYEDLGNIDNDLMVLHFDNFTPASTNEIPDEDEDKTLNDLGWTQSSWDEDAQAWESLNSPASSDIYEKTRPYRILNADGLSAPITALNKPVYEAVDDNVYERQLAATFVWDFNNYTDEAGEDVSGEEIAEYELFYGYDLLPHALKWGEDAFFRDGAKIYGATRSIAGNKLVIEAVDDNGTFTLAKTKFGTGVADIESALAAYPFGFERLEYRFTIDYAHHQKIYLNFDTASDTAYLYYNATGTDYITASYSIHTDPSYIEINTASLPESDRIIYGNLPTYFNPIIAGPYTADGSSSSNIADKAYYLGKHYIKTDEINRLLLEPVFFLNAIAKSDIENAFKLWRDTRHIEEGK